MKNKSVAWRTVRTLAILVKKKKKKKKYGRAWSCTSGIQDLLLKGPQNGLKYFKP